MVPIIMKNNPYTLATNKNISNQIEKDLFKILIINGFIDFSNLV